MWGDQMRNLVFMLALAVVASPTLAQDAPSAEVAATGTEAKPSGKIVFYRQSSIMGYAIACPIRYKGQEIVELGRGKFAEWVVPAGRYVVNNKTSSLEVIVDPGETRYVRCQIKPGFMTGRADLQIVDEESWNTHKADYERKEISLKP
ncbi:DUF2846 domain-containing protein [Novosphingobium sp.]|uniref:DUF2846 domain-containing protein n=1 Tax=Novosphingobium sp. TaxID=1874826 RepID=UPI002618155A|nr:DUF2846 domain-containing protein [Novosphingobium sp.]